MKLVFTFISICFLLACNYNEEPVRKIIEIKNDTIPISGSDRILGYIYYDDKGKAGLLNENKELVLKPHFDYIENWLQEGVFRVDSGGYGFWEIDYGDYVFSKIGLVNLKGEIIFPPQFDELSISDNSALVKVDSLFGYIDLNGNWLIPPKYAYAELFDKGATVVKSEGKFELINKKGEKIIDDSFDRAFGFKNGVTLVKKGEKYGFINHRGKYVLPLGDYSSIEEFNWFHGRFQAADKRFYLIDTAGFIPIRTGFDEVKVVREKDTIYAIGTLNKIKLKIKIGIYSR